ncbi:MAG: tetratricopeptide repeat protein [Desulfovermiculus sp.]
MTEIRNQNRLYSGVALGLVVLALVAMVGYSVAYRLHHPSLTREIEHTHSSGQEDMMDMVSQLMQRLEQNPEDTSALRGLGQAFMRMQAWSEAQRFWNRLLDLEPDNVQARQQLAMSLFRQEKYAAAEEELSHILKSDPDNAFVLFNLGILHSYYLENQEQGRSYFQQVLDAPGAEPELKEQAQEHLKNNGG